MEDQKLCKTCIEWLKNKYGESFYITPFSHCHHPEPTCWWCDEWVKFEKDSTVFEIVKKPIGLNPSNPECPVCGRKFKQEVEK